MIRPVVCSHERSGTHFLINTFENFGFDGRNFTDFDGYDAIPYAPENVIYYFNEQREKNDNSIIKSHYDGYFFMPCIEAIHDMGFRIIYVHREGDGVMRSFMRWVNFTPWCAGPKCDDVEVFKNSQPYGACLRYQFVQYATMWNRWQGHVNSWLNIPGKARELITYIRYEDMLDNYEGVVKHLSERLELPMPENIKIPSKFNQVMVDGFYLVVNEAENNTEEVGKRVDSRKQSAGQLLLQVSSH